MANQTCCSLLSALGTRIFGLTVFLCCLRLWVVNFRLPCVFFLITESGVFPLLSFLRAWAIEHDSSYFSLIPPFFLFLSTQKLKHAEVNRLSSFFFCCCEFVPDVQIIINRNRNQTQVLVQRSFALEWFVFTEKMNELLILSSVTFFFRKCFIECGVVWFGESSVRPARDPR